MLFLIPSSKAMVSKAFAELVQAEVKSDVYIFASAMAEDAQECDHTILNEVDRKILFLAVKASLLTNKDVFIFAQENLFQWRENLQQAKRAKTLPYRDIESGVIYIKCNLKNKIGLEKSNKRLSFKSLNFLLK